MSYQEKVLKKRMFQSSLAKLLEIAYQEPALPLNERRAVLAAIYMGGSSGCSKNGKCLPELTKQSTLATQNALMTSFLQKLENGPKVELIDTITKVSLLSSWAFSHPNQYEEILTNFAEEMVPEDMSRQSFSKNFASVLKAVSALRENWGIDKTLDLVSLASEMWAKKYHQR